MLGRTQRFFQESKESVEERYQHIRHGVENGMIYGMGAGALSVGIVNSLFANDSEGLLIKLYSSFLIYAGVTLAGAVAGGTIGLFTDTCTKPEKQEPGLRVHKKLF